MHIQQPVCGCRIIGTGERNKPLRIEFCPLHQQQHGTIAIVLVRMEQLRHAIQSRNWLEAEFQFDRVLRSLTKQQLP